MRYFQWFMKLFELTSQPAFRDRIFSTSILNFPTLNIFDNVQFTVVQLFEVKYLS